jgi:hypothetical protein
MTDSQYISICSICGHPLEKWQIAGETLDTTLIDYDERALIDISLIFCSECHEKIKVYANSSVEEAIARMRDETWRDDA